MNNEYCAAIFLDKNDPKWSKNFIYAGQQLKTMNN